MEEPPLDFSNDDWWESLHAVRNPEDPFQAIDPEPNQKLELFHRTCSAEFYNGNLPKRDFFQACVFYWMEQFLRSANRNGAVANTSADYVSPRHLFESLTQIYKAGSQQNTMSLIRWILPLPSTIPVFANDNDNRIVFVPGSRDEELYYFSLVMDLFKQLYAAFEDEKSNDINDENIRPTKRRRLLSSYPSTFAFAPGSGLFSGKYKLPAIYVLVSFLWQQHGIQNWDELENAARQLTESFPMYSAHDIKAGLALVGLNIVRSAEYIEGLSLSKLFQSYFETGRGLTFSSGVTEILHMATDLNPYNIHAALCYQLFDTVFARNEDRREEAVDVCMACMNRYDYKQVIEKIQGMKNDKRARPPWSRNKSIPEQAQSPTFPLLTHLRVCLLKPKLIEAADLARRMELCSGIDRDTKTQCWLSIWQYVLEEGTLFLDWNRETIAGYEEKSRFLYNEMVRGVTEDAMDTMIDFYQMIAHSVYHHIDASSEEKYYVVVASQQTVLRLMLKAYGLGDVTLLRFIQTTEWPIDLTSQGPTRDLSHWCATFLGTTLDIPPSLIRDDTYYVNTKTEVSVKSREPFEVEVRETKEERKRNCLDLSRFDLLKPINEEQRTDKETLQLCPNDPSILAADGDVLENQLAIANNRPVRDEQVGEPHVDRDVDDRGEIIDQYGDHIAQTLGGRRSEGDIEDVGADEADGPSQPVWDSSHECDDGAIVEHQNQAELDQNVDLNQRQDEIEFVDVEDDFGASDQPVEARNVTFPDSMFTARRTEQRIQEDRHEGDDYYSDRSDSHNDDTNEESEDYESEDDDVDDDIDGDVDPAQDGHSEQDAIPIDDDSDEEEPEDQSEDAIEAKILHDRDDDSFFEEKIWQVSQEGGAFQPSIQTNDADSLENQSHESNDNLGEFKRSVEEMHANQSCPNVQQRTENQKFDNVDSGDIDDESPQASFLKDQSSGVQHNIGTAQELTERACTGTSEKQINFDAIRSDESTAKALLGFSEVDKTDSALVTTKDERKVDSDATDDELERTLPAEKAETDDAAVGGEFGDTTDDELDGTTKVNRVAEANRSADVKVEGGYHSQDGYEPEDTHGFTEEEVSEAMHTEDEEEDRGRSADVASLGGDQKGFHYNMPPPKSVNTDVENGPHSSDDMDMADEHTEPEDLGAESSELEDTVDGSSAVKPSLPLNSAPAPKDPKNLVEYAQTAQHHHFEENVTIESMHAETANVERDATCDADDEKDATEGSKNVETEEELGGTENPDGEHTEVSGAVAEMKEHISIEPSENDAVEGYLDEHPLKSYPFIVDQRTEKSYAAEYSEENITIESMHAEMATVERDSTCDADDEKDARKGSKNLETEEELGGAENPDGEHTEVSGAVAEKKEHISIEPSENDAVEGYLDEHPLESCHSIVDQRTEESNAAAYNPGEVEEAQIDKSDESTDVERHSPVIAAMKSGEVNEMISFDKHHFEENIFVESMHADMATVERDSTCDADDEKDATKGSKNLETEEELGGTETPDGEHTEVSGAVAEKKEHMYIEPSENDAVEGYLEENPLESRPSTVGQRSQESNAAAYNQGEVEEAQIDKSDGSPDIERHSPVIAAMKSGEVNVLISFDQHNIEKNVTTESMHAETANVERDSICDADDEKDATEGLKILETEEELGGTETPDREHSEVSGAVAEMKEHMYIEPSENDAIEGYLDEHPLESRPSIVDQRTEESNAAAYDQDEVEETQIDKSEGSPVVERHSPVIAAMKSGEANVVRSFEKNLHGLIVDSGGTKEDCIDQLTRQNRVVVQVEEIIASHAVSSNDVEYERVDASQAEIGQESITEYDASQAEIGQETFKMQLEEEMNKDASLENEITMDLALQVSEDHPTVDHNDQNEVSAGYAEGCAMDICLEKTQNSNATNNEKAFAEEKTNTFQDVDLKICSQDAEARDLDHEEMDDHKPSNEPLNGPDTDIINPTDLIKGSSYNGTSGEHEEVEDQWTREEELEVCSMENDTLIDKARNSKATDKDEPPTEVTTKAYQESPLENIGEGAGSKVSNEHIKMEEHRPTIEAKHGSDEVDMISTDLKTARLKTSMLNMQEEVEEEATREHSLKIKQDIAKPDSSDVGGDHFGVLNEMMSQKTDTVLRFPAWNKGDIVQCENPKDFNTLETAKITKVTIGSKGEVTYDVRFLVTNNLRKNIQPEAILPIDDAVSSVGVNDGASKHSDMRSTRQSRLQESPGSPSIPRSIEIEEADDGNSVSSTRRRRHASRGLGNTALPTVHETTEPHNISLPPKPQKRDKVAAVAASIVASSKIINQNDTPRRSSRQRKQRKFPEESDDNTSVASRLSSSALKQKNEAPSLSTPKKEKVTEVAGSIFPSSQEVKQSDTRRRSGRSSKQKRLFDDSDDETSFASGLSTSAENAKKEQRSSLRKRAVVATADTDAGSKLIKHDETPRRSSRSRKQKNFSVDSDDDTSVASRMSMPATNLKKVASTPSSIAKRSKGRKSLRSKTNEDEVSVASESSTRSGVSTRSTSAC